MGLAAQDKGKGKAVEEAEPEEEQQRKKQRGDRLREIHDGMKIGDLYKDPCNRCIKDGVECRRAKGVRSTSCNACIEGKKKCVWSWESGEKKTKAKSKAKAKAKKSEAGPSGGQSSEAGGQPEAGPSKPAESASAPYAVAERMAREKNFFGLFFFIFKDLRKTRAAAESQQQIAEDMLVEFRSIAGSLERLADHFAPEEAEETEDDSEVEER